MLLDFTTKNFNELSCRELYKIMQLRSQVFVVEQHCIYLDADGKDEKSLHQYAFINNDIVAYCRLMPPNISYVECSIGRVVTSPNRRKSGFGIQLMQQAINNCIHLFNTNTIRIGAQCYLITFYQKLGFTCIGSQYLEDGIPHIEMIYHNKLV
jgi:ElaA protein